MFGLPLQEVNVCVCVLQFRLTARYKEEIVISYLQPGVEYCVNVSVRTLFNANAVSSQPHCNFTSPPLPASSRTSPPPDTTKLSDWFR